MTPPRPGKKILVADDSLTIQKVIRLALSNEGYEIEAVSDGNEALQQIAVFRPDLVLIDVSLPGKSAFEVKEQFNQENDPRGTRFVLMSSAFESVDEERATQVSFHGRLTKPFDPAHLRQVLSDALRGSDALQGSETSEATSSADPFSSFEADFPSAPTPPTAEPEEDDPFASLESGLPDVDAPITLAPPEPPAPPSPMASSPDDELWGSAGGDDIKNLTESTIRMSGLDEADDLDWSVNDSSHRIDAAAPAPAFSAEPDSDFHPAPTLSPPEKLHDLGGSTFRLDPPVAPPPPRPAFEPEQRKPESSSHVAAIDNSALEEIVQREVRATLEKLAKKILPEVAERVIKEEIHRLLQENP